MQIQAIGVVLLVGSFLQAPNAAETEQSTNNVDIRTISDTQGFDFTSYLREVMNRVGARWRSSIPESHVPGRVVISMSIDRDGSVQNLRVTQGSGNQYSTLVSGLGSRHGAAPGFLSTRLRLGQSIHRNHFRICRPAFRETS